MIKGYNRVVAVILGGSISVLLRGTANIQSEDLQNKFIEAARAGNLKSVQRYVRQGADLNRCDNRFNCPAIVLAAEKGHLDVVKFLHQNKADICAGDEIGWTALHAAATHKHNTVLNYLIAHGARVNQTTRTFGLAKLAPGCSQEAALACAARTGNREGVTLLLNAGAAIDNADEWGRTALFWTADRNYVDIFDTLLARGASLNATNHRDGRTLLHNAVVRGKVDTVRLLLGRGIAVDISDHKEQTALACALNRNGRELYPSDAIIALSLLQHNADPREIGLDNKDIRWWYGYEGQAMAINPSGRALTVNQCK